MPDIRLCANQTCGALSNLGRRYFIALQPTQKYCCPACGVTERTRRRNIRRKLKKEWSNHRER